MTAPAFFLFKAARLFLFIFLLIGTASSYDFSILNEAMRQNNLLISGLGNSYDPSLASSTTLNLFSNADPVQLSASANVIGPNALIDNTTGPISGLKILIATGNHTNHLSPKSSSVICDYAFLFSGEDLSQCDFDGDSCVEYENRIIVTKNLDVALSFQNKTTILVLTGNSISIPSSLLNDFKNSSGADLLDVRVYGTMEYEYEISNMARDALGCHDSYTSYFKSISIDITRSFRIAGTNRLPFLQAPILREQWFRNNRFDTIMLSQEPLYFSEIFMDNNLSGSFTMKSLAIVPYQSGLVQVQSTLVNSSGWSENTSSLVSPQPLSTTNLSYAYIYGFNHSYEGIGYHNLSIKFYGPFGGESQFNATLLSRTLSYDGNASELGSGANIIPANTRPSASFTSANLNIIQISMGMLALLLILSLFGSWLKN